MIRTFRNRTGPRDSVLPHDSVLSRRGLLRAAGAAAVVGPLATWCGTPAASAADYEPLHRYPRMVHEYFVAQLRQVEKQRAQVWEAMTTRAQAEEYVRLVRARIRECFGPEPPRTPLQSRVTGIVERRAYRIEKLIFESRPGFPVTANLYVPEGRKFPLPGVVGSCGHSDNGKAAEAYQSFAQGLARQGYLCLIFDPIGQGERLQYVGRPGRSRIGVGVPEHLHAGNQQYLVGEFFGAWRAWDGIRALDYLLTRDEVDPRHIGITGNSGGGTMTTWLCGVEPRWTMAAPACFVTTFRRNLENELPADTEQCPPRALALGLDHGDFLAAMAPKPVIILAKERDYFDVRGSEETFRRLQHLYGLLGAAENVALQIGPTYHGYSQENREAMYRWFNRVTKASEQDREPELTIEKDETLQCTPTGQVSELAGTRTVFSFTREASQALSMSRGEVHGEELRRALTTVLRLPSRDPEPPDYRIWRYLGSRGYPAKSGVAYAVETEPGIQAIVYRLTNEPLYSRPPRGARRAVLYVAHLSSDEELRTEPLLREVVTAQPDVPCFTCDVRGIGDSRPDTCAPNSFRSPYGNDFFYAAHGLMLDRPYLGQKTHDVLRVIDWLVSLGHTDIHLIGREWGALPATFAAVLCDDVSEVTLKNALTSFAAVAESEQYDWPLSTLPPAILKHFDLPDCYRALKNKRLNQLDPRGAIV